MRELDRRIVPLKPGNSGGGKAPDFWHAFEEGKDRVIGDKPANTANDREPSEKALRQSEGGKAAQAFARHRPLQRSECSAPLADSVDVKPVGKPDAGNRHVRFDERGGETGRCRMAQATAPLLDSTIRRAASAVPRWRCRFGEGFLSHPVSRALPVSPHPNGTAGQSQKKITSQPVSILRTQRIATKVEPHRPRLSSQDYRDRSLAGPDCIEPESTMPAACKLVRRQ